MRNIKLVVVSIILLVSWTTCMGQNPRTNLPSQQFQIADCSVPFQANVAGATYTVTQDLSFAPNDCIDVTASGITINLNGHTLSATPCGCTGISISKGAIGVHILGGGTIGGRGLNYSIHDMGSFALIENVTSLSQSTAGIFLDAVEGSVVNGVNVSEAFGRGGGIQLLDTDHCLVENSIANYNGSPPCGEGSPCGGSVAAGILVGNSGSQNLSKNNFIVGNQTNYNIPWGISVGGTGNVVASNTANGNNNGGFGGGWGIFAAGAGFPGPVNNNLVIDNSASQNEADDLYDSNAQCGTDRWVLNKFTTRSLTCIH
jgi:hypothetical protein